MQRVDSLRNDLSMGQKMKRLQVPVHLIASAPLRRPQIFTLTPRNRHVCHCSQALRVSRIETRQFSRSTRSLAFTKYTLPRNLKPGAAIDLPPKMSVVPEAPRKRTAYIALGSNMGDRIGWIEKACNEMDARGIRVTRTSSLWETEPMYVLDQDRFVNGACEVCDSVLAAHTVTKPWARLRRPWSRWSC
jgi:2-amino-4-hydroxy-6-hydroxymethyldihydropteridine diphosphokinase/dihydropteroate synthase